MKWKLEEPDRFGLGHRLPTIVSSEFSIDIVGVAFDGSRRNEELFGDLLVAQSAGQQIDDIELPVG